MSPKFKKGDRVVFHPDRGSSPFGYAADDGAVATVTAPFSGSLQGHGLVEVNWESGANGQASGAYYEVCFDLVEE